MHSDGYTLDDKRSPIEENDIPDIIRRYKDRSGEESRDRTEQSFFVPKQEIVENDYDLSINKYKKVVYEEVKYPPSKQIVEEMEDLTKQLLVEIGKLKEML